jgi:hypothetical protein
MAPGRLDLPRDREVRPGESAINPTVGVVTLSRTAQPERSFSDSPRQM